MFTTTADIQHEETLREALRGIRPTAIHAFTPVRYTTSFVCADCDEPVKAGWQHPAQACVRCGKPTNRVLSGTVRA